MSHTLSNKSVHVLTLIAEGHSYAQIVEGSHGLTYTDIFAAAKEALLVAEGKADSAMARMNSKHSRAYEKWSAGEVRKLLDLHAEGRSAREIAAHLGRRPSAIRSRLRKHSDERL